MYSDGKKCWAPNGQRPSLSEIPQLRALYEEADVRLARLEAFLALIQVGVGVRCGSRSSVRCTRRPMYASPGWSVPGPDTGEG